MKNGEDTHGAPAPDGMQDFLISATAILSSDPRILTFQVFFEANRKTAEIVPHIFIVPSTDWSARDRPRAEIEGSADSLRMWSYVFDAAYAKTVDVLKGPDFSGWNSSITGAPIPLDEMEQWRDHTIDRIVALSPSRVIEIGCGLGLLIDKLAADCSSYRALESSTAAVRFVQEWTRRQPGLHHVEVHHRGAEQIGIFPHASADTVILNSVVQYFPSYTYLHRILSEALPILLPYGYIFIGDIRDFRLLDAFNSGGVLARACPDNTVNDLRHSLRSKPERELSIDPQAFLRLDGYTTFRVVVKNSVSNNEMTNYRYDVILQKKSSTDDKIEPPKQVNWSGSVALDDLLQHENIMHEPLLVRGIANKWLTHDRIAANLIAQSDPSTSVGHLRQQIGLEAAACGPSWTPAEMVQQAQALGYRAEPLCCADPFQFDLLLSNPLMPAPMIDWTAQARGALSSDPILTEVAEHLTADLEQKLLQTFGRHKHVKISVVPQLPKL